jgi:hypothetical protein
MELLHTMSLRHKHQVSCPIRIPYCLDLRRQKQRVKKMNINKFTGSLFAQIAECLDILSLINELEDYKKIMSPVQKARVQKYLVDYLVMRLNALFENRKDVISFERLQHEYMSKNREFITKYDDIKKIFASLIKQIKNNRTKIAHNPKKNILGYSAKELADFEKTSGIKLPDLPQTSENQHILYRNLPRDGIIILLQKLKDLVFYEVLYPQARKYNPTTRKFVG